MREEHINFTPLFTAFNVLLQALVHQIRGYSLNPPQIVGFDHI